MKHYNILKNYLNNLKFYTRFIILNVFTYIIDFPFYPITRMILYFMILNTTIILLKILSLNSDSVNNIFKNIQHLLYNDILNLCKVP